MSVEKVTSLPNKERDEIQSALAMLSRIMPDQARRAMTMKKAFVKAGFTNDEALQLVAYALFK